MIRQLRLGPARNKITIDRGIRVRVRDGTQLTAEV
jgi:hypothetical protein